jgi:hypothetical protein
MRVDFIFSYWIFAWYLCYVFKWTPYNPKLSLLLGLIENGIILLLMIYYNTPLLYFLLVNMILKAIPYMTIRRRIQWDDVYPTAGLFLVYLIWLKVNGQSYTNLVEGIFRYVKGDASVFPVSNWLRNLNGISV